jgi:4-hydroxy-3-methylbut-2-enyl diphosphate reductase
MAEVIRANHSGFCFGVQRAIGLAFEVAEKESKKGRKVYTCGQLIHNRSVTDRLSALGAKEIRSLDQAAPGDIVIIRSHGEPKEFYDEAEKKGIELVDATCVFVEKIHHYVHEAYVNGRPVVMIGNRDHPEVVATNGWCGYNAVILGSREDAEAFVEDCPGFSEENKT